jgi:hypothetical protein
MIPAPTLTPVPSVMVGPVPTTHDFSRPHVMIGRARLGPATHGFSHPRVMAGPVPATHDSSHPNRQTPHTPAPNPSGTLLNDY